MTDVNRRSAGRSGRGPIRRALVVALVTAALAAPARGQESRASSPLVGTWQVVEWWVRDSKAGDRQYPYGRQPSGFCVYDRTGHFFVQVVRPAGEPLGEGRWRSLSADDLRKLVEQHLAYFGTYAVDTGRGIVTEHVEHDLARERAGRAREIPYRLDGDRLILGDGTAWQAVLMRTY
jgi:hypothetical protein